MLRGEVVTLDLALRASSLILLMMSSDVTLLLLTESVSIGDTLFAVFLGTGEGVFNGVFTERGLGLLLGLRLSSVRLLSIS